MNKKSVLPRRLFIQYHEVAYCRRKNGRKELTNRLAHDNLCAIEYFNAMTKSSKTPVVFPESRRSVQGGKDPASEYPSERHAEIIVGIDGCARYSAQDMSVSVEAVRVSVR